jgi:hypothetical protein
LMSSNAKRQNLTFGYLLLFLVLKLNHKRKKKWEKRTQKFKKILQNWTLIPPIKIYVPWDSYAPTRT